MTITKTPPSTGAAAFLEHFGRPPGIPSTLEPALVEMLVTLALQLDDPQRLFDAIGAVELKDGYAKRRLTVADCREVVRFTRNIRARVTGRRVQHTQEGDQIATLERLLAV